MNRQQIIAIVLTGLAILVGCDKSSRPTAIPPVSGEVTGDANPGVAATVAQIAPLPPRAPPRQIARVGVVELYESHSDTFQEPFADALPELTQEHLDSLLTLIAEGLFVGPDLAGQTDDKARRQAGLEFAADLGQLDQARVLVVYRTIFKGQGRSGGSVRYLAFAKLPAVLALPARYPATDRWAFEIATDGAMQLAARAVTAYPPELKELQLAAGRQAEQLTLSLAETSHELPQDRPVEIATFARTIAVSEQPIVADFAGPGGGEQAVEVISARDHGPINFNTRLVAVYRGDRPVWVGTKEDVAAARAQEKAP